MRFSLSALSDLPALPFDTIIDVRAPSEYAEDHIPGAINLPVLSDEERARVGTIYVQDSPFLARKLGAALVARNVAQHLEGPLADREGGWRPLVYCWRGGQRSGSFATILQQVGWRVSVLEGGYQSYRRQVVSQLYTDVFPAPVVLLDGNTGTAKTDILHEVAQLRCQVIDLEGLANHRGSVLGPRPGGQPSQKMFESRLSALVAGLVPGQPVLIEAESSKVGDLLVPPSLWKAMQQAPRITVTANVAARADYLAAAYGDLVEDTVALFQRLEKLVPFVGHKTVSGWQSLARGGAYPELARQLIEQHYDGRYEKGRPEGITALGDDLPIDLDPDGRARAARQIADRLRCFPG